MPTLSLRRASGRCAAERRALPRLERGWHFRRVEGRRGPPNGRHATPTRPGPYHTPRPLNTAACQPLPACGAARRSTCPFSLPCRHPRQHRDVLAPMCIACALHTRLSAHTTPTLPPPRAQVGGGAQVERHAAPTCAPSNAPAVFNATIIAVGVAHRRRRRSPPPPRGIGLAVAVAVAVALAVADVARRRRRSPSLAAVARRRRKVAHLASP